MKSSFKNTKNFQIITTMTMRFICQKNKNILEKASPNPDGWNECVGTELIVKGNFVDLNNHDILISI